MIMKENINNKSVLDNSIFKNNNHSYFFLNFNLVLKLNIKEKIINENISKILKEVWIRLCVNYNIELLKWENGGNYIHILYSAHPNTEHSKFINAYKSSSSRRIRKLQSIEIGNNGFWNKSFFLVTDGFITLDDIEGYLNK